MKRNLYDSKRINITQLKIRLQTVQSMNRFSGYRLFDYKIKRLHYLEQR